MPKARCRKSSQMRSQTLSKMLSQCEIARVDQYRRSSATAETTARGNVGSGKDGRTWLLVSEAGEIKEEEKKKN